MRAVTAQSAISTAHSKAWREEAATRSNGTALRTAQADGGGRKHNYMRVLRMHSTYVRENSSTAHTHAARGEHHQYHASHSAYARF
eukprot:1219891-Rhodomonas_salina.1